MSVKRSLSQSSSGSSRNYSPEFREKTVKLVTELGYSAKQVAEKLGCSKESVNRWVTAKKPKLDSETVARMELGEDENKRLRKKMPDSKWRLIS